MVNTLNNNKTILFTKLSLLQLYLLIYLKTYKIALYHTKADSKLRNIQGLVKL